MGSSGGGRGRTCGWSVFDGVKTPLPPTPDTLMAEIDAAIAASEYAHATILLSSFTTREAAAVEEEERPHATASTTTTYDVRLADGAYKAACASLAAGRPDAALRSLRVALASCPPDRSSALSKLRSLVSIASAQQQKQQLQR